MSPTGKEPEKTPARPELPEGVPVPGQVSDLWQIVQSIAREEDPRFEERNVVEHGQRQGIEGGKDIERWLEIYKQRVQPEYRYTFPAHHPRYRGCCLIQRNWPTGLSWEAFDEESLMRLPLPGQESRKALEKAIDHHLASKKSSAESEL